MGLGNRRGRVARTIAPPTWACDLVDDAVRGMGNGSGLDHLIRALDTDDLTADVNLLLPHTAGLVAECAPASRWGPIVRGVARRAAVTRSLGIGLAEQASRDLAEAGIPTMAVGDLGAALLGRRGPLTTARLLIPPDNRGPAVTRMVNQTTRDGVRLVVSPSFGAAFALPSALEWLWSGRRGEGLPPEPEFVLFESIATAALTGPTSRWYLDAALLGELDWGRVAQFGERFAWSAPIAEANHFLADRGWDIPRLPAARQTVIDVAVRSGHPRAARKPLLAARLLQRGGPAALGLARGRERLTIGGARG